MTTALQTQPAGSPAKLARVDSRLENLRAALDEADAAESVSNHKRLIAGCWLWEEQFRRFPSNANQHSGEDEKFGAWLKVNCPKHKHAKLARWMRGARNVLLTAFKLRSPLIEIDGIDGRVQTLGFSQMLSLPPAELSDQARGYRQQFFDFTADLTMKECVDGAFDGDDESRMTRAHNGRTKGGRGGDAASDRKDYGFFFGVHMLVLSKHVQDFDRLKDKRPAQRAEIDAALRGFILGGPVRESRAGKLKDLPPCPDWVVAQIKDLLKNRKS